MPCNAVRLSRSAILACHLLRSPAKYAATEQAIMTTNRNRKASGTRAFAFRPEGISSNSQSRYAPSRGGRDGGNYRLGSVERERKRASVADTNGAIGMKPRDAETGLGLLVDTGLGLRKPYAGTVKHNRADFIHRAGIDLAQLARGGDRGVAIGAADDVNPQKLFLGLGEGPIDHRAFAGAAQDA